MAGKGRTPVVLGAKVDECPRCRSTCPHLLVEDARSGLARLLKRPSRFRLVCTRCELSAPVPARIATAAPLTRSLHIERLRPRFLMVLDRYEQPIRPPAMLMTSTSPVTLTGSWPSGCLSLVMIWHAVLSDHMQPKSSTTHSCRTLGGNLP